MKTDFLRLPLYHENGEEFTRDEKRRYIYLPDWAYVGLKAYNEVRFQYSDTKTTPSLNAPEDPSIQWIRFLPLILSQDGVDFGVACYCPTKNLEHFIENNPHRP